MTKLTGKEFYGVTKAIVRQYYNHGIFRLNSKKVTNDDIVVAYVASSQIESLFVPAYLIEEAKLLRDNDGV